MDIDPARYDGHTPGEMSILDELQRAYSELDQLQAEIARLRSLIPVWVTVTDDPATLPEENRSILTKSRIGSKDFVTFYRFGRVLRPGDCWCYVPTPDPKVANQTIPDTTDRENRASESHISKEPPVSQWIVAFTDGRNGSVLAQSFDFREQSADIIFRNGDGVVCILPTSIITSIISSDPENGDQTYHA